jgi:hypothetical protein
VKSTKDKPSPTGNNVTRYRTKIFLGMYFKGKLFSKK